MSGKINKIFQLKFTSDLVGMLEDDFKKKDSSFVVKINSEFLLRAMRNEEFFEVLTEKATGHIADGVGVAWAFKYLSIPTNKNKFLGRLQSLWQLIYTAISLIFYPKYCLSSVKKIYPGQDCFYQMLEWAENNNKSVFLFGWEQEVLKDAVESIKKKFPKLYIAGTQNGYSDKGQEVINLINASRAEFLFVGLGSPEQEYWIRDNLKSLKTIKVAVGEGGTLDYIAGSSKRAPKIINKMGLEWLWRLFFSPNKTRGARNRLSRVWNAVPVFMLNVYKQKVKS